MNINLFIVLAAPFFSLLFTEPADLLIKPNPTNSYLQMILLNMGASLSIFLINTTGYRYDFARLFPVVDIGLVSLELLELGCFIDNMEIRYGLYVFKKVCTGMAIGANFYLGVVLIKRKFTLEREFMRIVMLLYMCYDAGLLIGTIMRDIPTDYLPYCPITSVFALVRLIYVCRRPVWLEVEPTSNDLQILHHRRENLKHFYNQLSQSFYETDTNRSSLIEKLFHEGHIRYFVCFFLITVASQITPMLQFQKIAISYSPTGLRSSFAIFQLLGSIFLYLMIPFIHDKLRYYLAMGITTSMLCFMIYMVDKLMPNVNLKVCLILLYMVVYGGSLGPFFYIFVGYRYNTLGFAICYILKWLVYALQAVIGLFIDQGDKDTARYNQIIATSVLLFVMSIIIYALMRENEIVQRKIVDNLPKRLDVLVHSDSMDLRDSGVVEVIQ